MLIFAPEPAMAAADAGSGSVSAAPAAHLARLLRLAGNHFTGMAGVLLLGEGAGQLLLSEGLAADVAAGYAALCLRAMPASGPLLLVDAAADPRFAGQGLPRCVLAYPVRSVDGVFLGILGLFAARPRELGDADRAFLADLLELIAAAYHCDANLQALQDNERRMALAIAGSGTGIWDRNIVTGEIYYSQGWKALLGYREDEVSNRIEDSYTRVHPDDLPYVQARIQAHLEGRTENYAVEHRIQSRDGSYRWISSRGKVVDRDERGRPLRMIGTSTDITALHAMAERLRQSVELITNLTNEVPGLVFQFRRQADGREGFAYLSAGIVDIYELQPQELAADSALLETRIHPDDQAGYRAALAVSAAGMLPWHFEYRVRLPRQGLRWRQLAARPQRLEAGGIQWHGLITDITERKRMETELQELATTDALTRLPNRRHFMGRIEAELARVQRGGGCAAVLMCDLDYFKAINDRWGHAVGDQALRHFASVLREQLRRSDSAGRVGGEEFAVLLGEADLEAAAGFAQRLQQRLGEALLLPGEQSIVLTVSIGIALLSAQDASVDHALSRSDQALYKAKALGRNRVECL